MEHGKIGEVFNFGVLHLEWPTALFIFVVFMVTMFLLNNLLFKPVIRTIEGREADVNGNKEKVKKLIGEIETAEKGYQEKLAAVHAKVQATRDAAVKEAMAQAKEVIAAAKASTEATLKKAEQEIATEREAALRQATELTKGLAQLINNKAIG